MRVRFSNSRVFKWPDKQTVHAAVTAWAREQAERKPELLRVGYFGSYARGNWGVGSDVDLVLIVARTETPFIYRGAEWDTHNIPVDTDLLVYTPAEWAAVNERAMFDPLVWVHRE